MMAQCMLGEIEVNNDAIINLGLEETPQKRNMPQHNTRNIQFWEYKHEFQTLRLGSQVVVLYQYAQRHADDMWVKISSELTMVYNTFTKLQYLSLLAVSFRLVKLKYIQLLAKRIKVISTVFILIDESDVRVLLRSGKGK